MSESIQTAALGDLYSKILNIYIRVRRENCNNVPSIKFNKRIKSSSSNPVLFLHIEAHFTKYSKNMSYG